MDLLLLGTTVCCHPRRVDPFDTVVYQACENRQVCQCAMSDTSSCKRHAAELSSAGAYARNKPDKPRCVAERSPEPEILFRGSTRHSCLLLRGRRRPLPREIGHGLSVKRDPFYRAHIARG